MKMEIKKKNGVAVLVLDNIDFKIKTATRYKEGHYIMIKGSIQEAITIISIYAPTQQYHNTNLNKSKGEIDTKTTLVGVFHTSLTPMDRLSRQKINKET